MIRTALRTAAASVAILIAGSALAAPGGGGGGPAGGGNVNAGANAGMGGPSQSGLDARVNSQGPMNASPTGISHASPNSVLNTNSTTTTTTRATNSQGLQHASPTGISHANTNSVLGRGAVPSTSLPGLTTGLTVQNSSGTTLGTVSRVVTDSSGNIRLVIVTSSTGQTYRLAPTTLSISGGVVTTTSM